MSKTKKKIFIITSSVFLLLLWLSIYFDVFCLLPWSVENNHLGFTKTLLWLGTDINNSYEPYDRNVLHIAAGSHNAETVAWLVENGAHVNSSDNQGSTPLHLASRYAIVEELLSNGADIDKKDELGCSPLFYFYNKKEILEYILQKNNISIKNEKNIWGVTPLHVVAEKANAELLIKLEANINAQTVEGDTPLHLAVRHNNIDVAEFLLEQGANSKIKNKDGFLPLHYARSKRMKDLFEKHTK